MTGTETQRPGKIAGVAVVEIIFGAMTIVSGGKALFGGPAAQAAVGDYVSFVLWFNFLAGFAYVIAGVGLFMWKKWAVNLAYAIAILTLLVFAVFGVHIFSGNAFEARTIGAMVLRSGVWIAIAFVARMAWKNTRAAM